jgi:hypothetical protein
VRVEDARVIRPDDANDIGPSGVDHLILQPPTQLPGFGEAASQNDGTLDTLRSA